MRAELPTLPCDLSEFARAHTGPESWSALSDEPESTLFVAADALAITDDDTFDNVVAGPLLEVRRSDVPHIVAAPPGSEAGLLDHREGFILSLLDGHSDLETVLDIAGMPHDEALAVLCGLCARGLVTLKLPGDGHTTDPR
jgi:hypothetical protein